jgi:hypothetical protein
MVPKLIEHGEQLVVTKIQNNETKKEGWASGLPMKWIDEMLIIWLLHIKSRT